MARCGRCGLFAAHSSDSGVKTVAGTCMWFQMQIPRDALWDDRKCKEFFEAIPNVSPLEHWTYRISRDDIGLSERNAKIALFFSSCSLIISLIALLIQL